MSRSTLPLDVIHIADPCTVDWNDMRGGDARVRFCQHCSQNVYNLSEMTREAAEKLVGGREERLCVRFYRRADGTVITRDCENVWRRAAKRVSRFAVATATLAIAAMLSPFAGLSRTSKGSPVEQCEVPKVIDRPIAVMGDVAPVVVQGGCRPPTPQPPPAPPPIMGKIAAPATQPATQPSA